jgi:hypothetical protein
MRMKADLSTMAILANPSCIPREAREPYLTSSQESICQASPQSLFG